MSDAAAAPAADAGAPEGGPASSCVRVEDWPASDDFLLREAVEAGAALGAIARGILPFSQPRTREEITARWRALLYDARVALPARRLRRDDGVRLALRAQAGLEFRPAAIAHALRAQLG